MSRGSLRIYLGAAPGVGKTFAMLDEGRRRSARGTDVVVAFVDTHDRPATEAQLEGLEVLPRLERPGLDAAHGDLDVDGTILRAPDVALVDDLARTNGPGARHPKRWQDVEALLDAGIDVIATINITHLDSVKDVVERITGITQGETVPDEVVRSADQIELIDMSPEALRRRLAHGNIYPPELVDAALANFFRVGNLSALRELALLWTADNVDAALHEYREVHGIEASWETRERVLVALTGAPSGDHLIRRAARMARRAHADLIGVHVRPSDGPERPSPGRLDEHRQLVADLGGTYHEVVGSDIADALIGTARSVDATQLVLGSTARSRRATLLRGSVINKVVRLSGPIDVHVISTDADADAAPRPLPAVRSRRQSALPRRRQVAGWALAIVGIPALSALLLIDHAALSLSTILLTNLLLVVAVAALGGLRPAVVAAVVSAQTVNWYFTEPIHTFTIDDDAQLVALVVFVAVGVLVGVLVGHSARQAAEAHRARAEAEALAATAGRLSGLDDPVRGVLGHLRITFEQDAVAIMERTSDGGWVVDLVDGEPAPTDPADGMRFELADGLALLLVPGRLAAEDLRVLRAFAAQLADGLERRSLEAAAIESDASSRAEALRTAILRAVSHDLRSPLASIKASSTSLLQDDIEWTPGQRREFASTIDEEADRLNRLVANLLDMSRIEAGAVHPSTRGVAIEEVVAAALDTVVGADTRVVVDVPATLPVVQADAALLERVLANLTTNALEHSGSPAADAQFDGPDASTVRIEARVVGARLVVRVIDRGAGLPAGQRANVFDPFQRLDDSSGGGVGLGLAVVRGFVAAMGGEVTLDDTPGGGVTATVSLRLAATDLADEPRTDVPATSTAPPPPPPTAPAAADPASAPLIGRP